MIISKRFRYGKKKKFINTKYYINEINKFLFFLQFVHIISIIIEKDDDFISEQLIIKINPYIKFGENTFK